MENLEQVLKYWETDADMDQTEPGKELLKIPKLHNKYLSILTKHKIASKKAHFDYLRMRKIKWEYYTGKMSKEELDEFVDNLQQKDLEKIKHFFETMPEIKKNVQFKCPKCAYEENIEIKGIQNFFV